MKIIKFLIGLTILLAGLWISTFFSAKKAPERYVKALKETCIEIAAESQVNVKMFKKYVVDCINEELVVNGYQKVNYSFDKIK